jgi:uncharacterized protein YoxC
MKSVFEQNFTETLFYNNCYKFKGINIEEVKKQFEKIHEEIKEFEDATYKWLKNEDTKEHVNEEGFDGMQSIFTLLRNINNSIEYVEENHKHLTKLLDRDLKNDETVHNL